MMRLWKEKYEGNDRMMVSTNTKDVPQQRATEINGWIHKGGNILSVFLECERGQLR